MAVEWTITIEGKNEFGEVCRREVRITKSWDRLFDGDIGLSVDDGKKIMAALQSAVVNLPTIDGDIRAVKWRFWHGRVDRAIRDLESLVARLKQPQGETEFSIARLRNLSAQLLTYVKSNRGAIIDYGKRYRAGCGSPLPSQSQR